MSATELTITDLTRMSGNRVCIAGITDDGRTIRPELEKAFITEDWLFRNNQLIIKPFARVQFDLIENRPDPPHTEDWIIHPNRKRFIGELNLDERLELLINVAQKSVKRVYGTEIMHESGFGYFIPHGKGKRSLGTLRPKTIDDFTLTNYGPKLDYRIGFTDWRDQYYRLGITDLTMRFFIAHLRTEEALSNQQISNRLITVLNDSQVFLQMGLARAGWERHPDFCHLQINGVYTFPDYLDGRCFADFKHL